MSLRQLLALILSMSDLYLAGVHRAAGGRTVAEILVHNLRLPQLFHASRRKSYVWTLISVPRQQGDRQ